MRQQDIRILAGLSINDYNNYNYIVFANFLILPESIHHHLQLMHCKTLTSDIK